MGSDPGRGAGVGRSSAVLHRSSFTVHPDAVGSLSAITGKKETGRGESRGRFGRAGLLLALRVEGTFPRSALAGWDVGHLQVGVGLSLFLVLAAETGHERGGQEQD